MDADFLLLLLLLFTVFDDVSDVVLVADDDITDAFCELKMTYNNTGYDLINIMYQQESRYIVSLIHPIHTTRKRITPYPFQLRWPKLPQH